MKCGVDLLHYNRQLKREVKPTYFTLGLLGHDLSPSSNHLLGRDVLPTIDCSSRPDSVLYVGVVADCNYSAQFDHDHARIRSEILKNFSQASGIYEKAFKIRLGVISIEIMDTCDDSANPPTSPPTSRKKNKSTTNAYIHRSPPDSIDPHSRPNLLDLDKNSNHVVGDIETENSNSSFQGVREINGNDYKEPNMQYDSSENKIGLGAGMAPNLNAIFYENQNSNKEASNERKQTDRSWVWNYACSDTVTMDKRLSSFSEWRGTQGSDAGVYHLLTACKDGATVGLAWIGQICKSSPFRDSTSGETVAGTSVSAKVPNHYSVIAHEIAHVMGAVHDCDHFSCGLQPDPNSPSIDNFLNNPQSKSLLFKDEINYLGNENNPKKMGQLLENALRTKQAECCKCPDGRAGCDCAGRFIMNADSAGKKVNVFSPCTIGEICSKIPVIASSCLHEPGKRTLLTANICGNGIKDEGEECDCGSPEECAKSKCCNSNCKLKPNARCADENDKCCSDCQIVKSSEEKICFMTQSSCQNNSICDGISPSCPIIKTMPDGIECEIPSINRKGHCASGICTSRSMQCEVIGLRQGLTEACEGRFEGIDPCRILCRRPGSIKCVAMDSNFIDGTSCGVHGVCHDGLCSESDFESFAYENVISIGVIMGCFLFIIMLVLGRLIFRRRRIR